MAKQPFTPESRPRVQQVMVADILLTARLCTQSAKQSFHDKVYSLAGKLLIWATRRFALYFVRILSKSS